MRKQAVAFALVSLFGCVTAEVPAETDEVDDQVDDAAAGAPEGGLRALISKQATVDRIKQVARARGITNPMLVAGIAWAETNLAHCRSDYYVQQCRQTAGTPVSPSCGGGSVLIGNADPSCNQGGLGLFQIDYGTQAQTIAHYGNRVLSLEGNIDIGIDHIINDVRICSLTPSFGSDLAVARRKAIAWINTATKGTANYNTFMMCMSRHYNGAGTQAQANYYRTKTDEAIRNWGGSAPPPPSGSHPGTVNTNGTPLSVRASASTSAAVVGTLADGAAVTITCQKTGTAVTGTYGTSAIWDKVGGGFVSDAFIATGSDGRVAPDCP